MDLMNQLILANKKLSHKDMEIANLNSNNDILENELKNEKEYMEKFNKPKEEMK